MILTSDQVKQIALSPTDEWIKTARKDAEKYRMHFYGENVLKYITTIEGLENDKQLELRQSCKISNEYIVNNLLKPFENIWSAKGGGFVYEISKEIEVKFKEFIDHSKHVAYIKDSYFPRFITDPNGLLFVENDAKEAWPTYKSISSIKNMQLKGEIPDYVCFEIDVEEKGKDGKVLEQVLWLVDDAFYYRIKIKNDTIDILEQKKNSYEEVPAIVNSGIKDTLRNIRVSPIHKQLDLLDSFLRKNSVKEVYQMKHDFPIPWEYESRCPACKGTGYLDSRECEHCNGTGLGNKKNVSDVRILKVPTSTEGIKLAPDIAGYINPPWAGEKQRLELSEVFKDMYFSLWGATIERADNETATGRFIDVQPVNNTLTNHIDIIQPRHNRYLELICKFYFPLTVEKVNYIYGDRFLIETPDQLLEKYTKAKTGKAPEMVLTQILEQYIESEYRRDDIMRNYNLKLIELTPFIHHSIQEVQSMPVSDEDKLKKTYFQEWLSTKMLNEIIDKKLPVLLTELTTYVSSKILNNGKTDVEGATGRSKSVA